MRQRPNLVKNIFYKTSKLPRQTLQWLFNITKKTFEWIKKYFATSMEQRIKTICKLPMHISALFLIANFIVGVIILYCNHCLSYFFLHLICLTLNIMITLFIGRKYIDTLTFLNEEIAENHVSENVELKILYFRFQKYALCRCNILACVIVLVIFFWGILSQHYIKANIVGLYAVFMVTITVSISVIGYIQYLWVLWFLYRVSKCSEFYFNKNAPAHTPFLIEIANLLKIAKWCFFLEGFLYVFEYYILIPKGQITTNSLNMPNNTSFLITWFVLFVVIILAFPIIVIMQESFVSNIVDKLKNQRVQLLSQEFDIVNTTQTTDKFIYSAMIKNILASADYPIKNKSFGPTIVSLTTFCLHAITFLSQLPSLSYLF